MSTSDSGNPGKPDTDQTGFWRLSPQDRRVLATAAVVLAAAAAVVQVVGTNGESPAKATVLAVSTIVVGGILLLAITRIGRSLKRKIHISYLLATCTIIAAVAIGGVIGYGISFYISQRSHTSPPVSLKKHSTRHASSSPTSTVNTSPAPNATQHSESSRLHVEITDNGLGTQVFSSPQGGAVSQNGAIPYDTYVKVECWTKNESTMHSINAFYLIESAPWVGDYAPADTFANGDPIGEPGSTTIDPAVPECR